VPPKKKTKTYFFCKMHGPDQRHNTENCKVINTEIKKLKGRKPSYNGNNHNNQQSGNNAKPAWTETRKRQATSYSTEELKEVIPMTRKKATEDAKLQYKYRVQEELHQIEIKESAAQELDKMRQMELFITNMVDDGESDVMEEEGDLTQA
jgi:hypothetical protein